MLRAICIFGLVFAVACAEKQGCKLRKLNYSNDKFFDFSVNGDHGDRSALKGSGAKFSSLESSSFLITAKNKLNFKMADLCLNVRHARKVSVVYEGFAERYVEEYVGVNVFGPASSDRVTFTKAESMKKATVCFYNPDVVSSATIKVFPFANSKKEIQVSRMILESCIYRKNSLISGTGATEILSSSDSVKNKQ